MSGLRIPRFEKGNIVTAEMLEAVRDLSVDYQKIFYAGYGDGVLTGCDITVNDGQICIGEGIAVHGGRLYFITEPLCAEYYPSNEWMILQIDFGAETVFRNVEERIMTAVITKETEKNPDSIEVCRFRLQQGAVLRANYRDFQDQDTEFDTVNEINAEWSSYGKSTISAKLLISFADEMGKKGTQDPMDFSFCQQIYQMNGQSVNRRGIENYINQRLQLKKESYSNREIYQKLAEILKSSNGKGRGMSDRQARPSRIIVD